jgi:hypothetical protein
LYGILAHTTTAYLIRYKDIGGIMSSKTVELLFDGLQRLFNI